MGIKLLKNNISDSNSLAKALRFNGGLHQNYKVYTSMERALAFLLTGKIYLSDGQKWNDKEDRISMNEKKVYGHSFSCSTKENIAMWMLYSGEHGKKGAVIDFLPSVIKSILDIDTVELGLFDGNGQFDKKYKLKKTDGSFDLFMTDVLYVDLCKNKAKITVRNDHATVNPPILVHDDIFCKNYAWSYEVESRLVLRLSDEINKIAQNEKLTSIRITLPDKYLNRMRKDRLIRSPLYTEGVETGRLSELNKNVIWDI
ncbi:MAG: hypothetical protein MJ131_05480 [Lachnospiraceae bacterium]|nr:hypothetical protein [Lachnospiraceae bacterium]